MLHAHKIVRSLAFIFLAPMSILHTAQMNDNERFAQANEAYQTAKYDHAYQLYQEISHPTARVYFNMGNCAIKLDKKGEALWRLRQAEERWGFFDYKELRTSLEQAYANLNTTENKKDPRQKIKQSTRNEVLRILNVVPLIIIQLLFLLFWTLLFVFARRLLKQKKRTLLLTLFISVLASGGMLLHRQVRMMRVNAIVIESHVTLYAGPSTTYQQVGDLAQGVEVLVDRQRQDFCKIKTKNKFGWVTRASLGFI